MLSDITMLPIVEDDETGHIGVVSWTHGKWFFISWLTGRVEGLETAWVNTKKRSLKMVVQNIQKGDLLN